MIAGAMSLDGWLQFSGLELKDSYVRQETERMMQNHNAVRAKN